MPSMRFPTLFMATAFVQVLNAEAMQAAGRGPPPTLPRCSQLLGQRVRGRAEGQETARPARPACWELSWLDREACAIAVASQHREHVPELGGARMGSSDAPGPLMEAGDTWRQSHHWSRLDFIRAAFGTSCYKQRTRPQRDEGHARHRTVRGTAGYG